MKDKNGVEFKAGDIYFYSERNIGNPNSLHANYADSFHEVVEEGGELKSKYLLTNFKGKYISEEDAGVIISGSTPWGPQLLLQEGHFEYQECYEILPLVKRKDITKDFANKVCPLEVVPQGELSFRCSDFLYSSHNPPEKQTDKTFIRCLSEVEFKKVQERLLGEGKDWASREQSFEGETASEFWLSNRENTCILVEGEEISLRDFRSPGEKLEDCKFIWTHEYLKTSGEIKTIITGEPEEPSVIMHELDKENQTLKSKLKQERSRFSVVVALLTEIRKDSRRAIKMKTFDDEYKRFEFKITETLKKLGEEK